jgi:hypothetical protein
MHCAMPGNRHLLIVTVCIEDDHIYISEKDVPFVHETLSGRDNAQCHPTAGPSVSLPPAGRASQPSLVTL